MRKKIFFHNYGIILQPTGSSLFFVNPNWFANIVSRLYYYAEMRKDDYVFSRKDLFCILIVQMTKKSGVMLYK